MYIGRQKSDHLLDDFLKKERSNINSFLKMLCHRLCRVPLKYLSGFDIPQKGKCVSGLKDRFDIP